MWLVIALLVVGGAWYVLGGSKSAVQDTQGAAMEDKKTGDSMEAGDTKPTSSLTGGVSDSDLDNDLNTIDGQMKSANDAGSSATSFNDTPVQQTE